MRFWRMRTCSGVPNTTQGLAIPILFYKGGINACLWNTRGLRHHKPALRKAKCDEVWQLSRDYQVIALLEAHGSPSSLQVCLAKVLRTHFLFTSHMKDDNGDTVSDAGGLCVLVSKALFGIPVSEFPVVISPPPGVASFSQLINGRAIQLSLYHEENGNQKWMHFFFIHNYGFSAFQTDFLIKAISRKRDLSLNFPRLHSCILMGDFNLEPKGSRRLKLTDPAGLSGEFNHETLSPPRPFEAKWNKLFDALLEIDYPLPSHLHVATLTLSKINRTFAVFPKSSVPVIKIQAGIKRDATWYEANRLSDHSPIFVSFSGAKSIPKGELRIKPEWCKHPAYAERLQQLSNCINWNNHSIAEQSIYMKEIQRDAALWARDKLFLESPGSKANQLCRFGSIARCVWNKDVKLCKILTNHSELGREHLLLEDGVPCLRDPVIFEEAVRVARAEDADAQRKRIEEDTPAAEARSSTNADMFTAGRRKCKIDTINRLGALWVPITARLVILGSRLSSEDAERAGLDTTDKPADDGGRYLFTGQDHIKAIIWAWQRIFGKELTLDDELLADHIIAGYDINKWDWSKAVPFSQNLVGNFVSRLKHTGTGKDGVHNFCFRFGGETVIRYLVKLIDAYFNEQPLPEDINDGLFVFLSKADREDDSALSSAGIYRTPTDLRPLTLKNTENKIVAGVCNTIIKPVVEKAAEVSQRGFVANRQLVQNAVDLDFSSRLDALEYTHTQDLKGFNFWSELMVTQFGLLNSIPVALLFDYASAFPSVSHAWIRYLLLLISIPDGIFSLIMAMYNKNKAFMLTPDGIMFMFYILCGVLQGCPLSGSLFVMVIDPLLFMLKIHIEDTGLGIVRACADDIGVSLRKLQDVIFFEQIFSRFTKISGLSLNAKKCVIILTCISASKSNVEFVRKWLSHNVPAWQNMIICDGAKYLGIFLGPKVKQLLWKKPLEKFKDRVNNIHSLHLPANLAKAQFTNRALPILAFVAQVAPPPPYITRIGMNAIMKCLRLCGNSLSYDTAASLDLIGGPNFPDVKAFLKSSRMRAAAKTLSGYQPQHEQLLKSAIEALPFASHRYKYATPLGWDTPALCTNLFDALNEIQGRGIDLGMQKFETNALLVLNAGPYSSPYLRLHEKYVMQFKSIQSHIYSHIILPVSVSTAAWRNLLRERASMFFGDEFELPSSVLTPLGFHEFMKVLLTLNPSERMMVIKTLINSWSTSRRLHEGVIHPCLFCGEQEDDLKHYLRCDFLWDNMISSAKLPSTWLSLPPPVRLGLDVPNQLGLKLLVCGFRVYHTFKLVHIDQVLQSLASGDVEFRLNLLLELAEVYLNELGVI